MAPGAVILTVADETNGKTNDETTSASAEDAPDLASEKPDSEPEPTATPPSVEAKSAKIDETDGADGGATEAKLAASKIPELGENIEEGTVVNILVSVEDMIEAGQPLIELETDKAVLEIPADVGGIVQSISVKRRGSSSDWSNDRDDQNNVCRFGQPSHA